MHQRINITLPKDTIQMIDRIAAKGNRSAFIDKAVRDYIRSVGRKNLKKMLKEGALARAERDLSIVEEWSSIEDGW
jgi:CopG family transcriptional regulator / antitoxin EndoAI